MKGRPIRYRTFTFNKNFTHFGADEKFKISISLKGNQIITNIYSYLSIHLDPAPPPKLSPIFHLNCMLLRYVYFLFLSRCRLNAEFITITYLYFPRITNLLLHDSCRLYLWRKVIKCNLSEAFRCLKVAH